MYHPATEMVVCALSLLRMHQASRRQANADANTQPPRLPGFSELNGRPVVSAPQFMKDMDKRDDNARQHRCRPSSGTIDPGLSQASRMYMCMMKISDPVSGRPGGVYTKVNS